MSTIILEGRNIDGEWHLGLNGKAVASGSTCLAALKSALRNKPTEATVVIGWNGPAPDNGDVSLAIQCGLPTVAHILAAQLTDTAVTEIERGRSQQDAAILSKARQ